jgi:hypothetical protein
MGKGELVETLLRSDINKDLLLPEVADIFFKYKYEDIALDLYQQVNEENISKQGFINVIELLISNDDNEEANRIALQAINYFNENFIFYKFAIETSENNDELIDTALEKYKESNWLKQQSFLANFF